MRGKLIGLLIAAAAALIIVALAIVVIDNNRAEAPAPAAHFQEAGLITMRDSGEPGPGPFATQVRAGDPFLYVVFVLSSDDPAHRFAVSVDWKHEGKVIQHDQVAAIAGERAWSLCESCHDVGEFEVDLEIVGTQARRTIPFSPG
jgi:hypothetical protein